VHRLTNTKKRIRQPAGISPSNQEEEIHQVGSLQTGAPTSGHLLQFRGWTNRPGRGSGDNRPSNDNKHGIDWLTSRLGPRTHV
jgi:hypothetical protein